MSLCYCHLHKRNFIELAAIELLPQKNPVLARFLSFRFKKGISPSRKADFPSRKQFLALRAYELVILDAGLPLFGASTLVPCLLENAIFYEVLLSFLWIITVGRRITPRLTNQLDYRISQRESSGLSSSLSRPRKRIGLDHRRTLGERCERCEGCEGCERCERCERCGEMREVQAYVKDARGARRT